MLEKFEEFEIENQLTVYGGCVGGRPLSTPGELDEEEVGA